MTIITWDEECIEEKDGKRIKFIPLLKWITGERAGKAI